MRAVHRVVLEARLDSWERRNTRLIRTVIATGALTCILLVAVAVAAMRVPWALVPLLPLLAISVLVFAIAKDKQERLSNHIVMIRRMLRPNP